MTASPDPRVGLPSEEEIARAMRPPVWARCDAAGVTSESMGSGVTLGDLIARATSLLDANAVLSLIRPAFEAKDAQIRKLVLLLDKQLGTPCEQIRHQQEVEALQAKLAQAVEDEREACAKIAQPARQQRPCDCDHCYCGNAGNAEDVARWDADNATATAIRARAASAAARGETP